MLLNWKTFLRDFCVVLMGLAVFFTASMILVYLIPASATSKNVIASARYVEADAAATVHDDAWTSLSPTTEAVMLSMVGHEAGQGPVRDAMLGSYYYDSSLQGMVNGVDKPANRNYEWYWHGWMVLFRPLMVFFDAGFIKRLFWLAFFFLFALTARYLSAFRGGLWYVLALCVTYMIVAPFTVGSLVDGFVPIISLAGSLWVLRSCNGGNNQSVGNKLLLGFFVIGAVTQFLDFLTIPVFTLIIPLVICVIAIGEGEFPSKPVVTAGIFTACIVMWMLGYGGLWFGKWIIASVLLGYDVVSIGAAQVLFRAGAEGAIGYNESQPITTSGGMDINAINSIKVQIEALAPFFDKRILIVPVLLGVAMLVQLEKKGKSLSVALLLLLIVLIPFVWYALVSNHSMIHSFFVHRLLAGSVFAYLAAFVFCITHSRFQSLNSEDEETPKLTARQAKPGNTINARRKDAG